MAIRRIREFLTGGGVPFGYIIHPHAFTTQEVAQVSMFMEDTWRKP